MERPLGSGLNARESVQGSIFGDFDPVGRSGLERKVLSDPALGNIVAARAGFLAHFQTLAVDARSTSWSAVALLGFRPKHQDRAVMAGLGCARCDKQPI